MAPELLTRCADLLYQEAAYLDERRWSEWLALYTEDAEFWAPAWDEDGRPTDDPQSQLSLIHGESPRIAKKKVILLNDVVESVLDVNHV